MAGIDRVIVIMARRKLLYESLFSMIILKHTYNYVPTYFKFNVTFKVRYAYAALTVFFSFYYRIRLFWSKTG
jgi:hypothetical protein